MRQEAMANRLEELVEEGVMTQEEADQYKEWCDARPDVPLQNKFGSMRFQSGFRGHGGMHGHGGFGFGFQPDS